MAAGAITAPRYAPRHGGQVLASGRGPAQPASRATRWSGTPEIYFPKAIDNSRLVKVADVERGREMRQFAIALAVLFFFVMVYAWQHFSAIEYGYRIETLKSQRDSLTETYRALRLEEASLRDPERIDALARQMGLESPQAGQVQRMAPEAKDSGVPVLAQADVAVISTP